jgi:hypothetical protein
VFEMKENFVAQFNELMIILNVQAKGWTMFSLVSELVFD